MRNRYRAAWALLLCGMLCLGPVYTAAALENGTADSQQSILQKGLTLYEIDQELNRIGARETELNGQIESTEKRIAEQEQESKQTRKHAGQVLRAYYMGDRDAIWVMLLSIRSLSEAWTTMEYLTMIMENDRLLLNRHTDANKRLQAARNELLQSKNSLQDTKTKYMRQKAELAVIQRQLDEELARQKEASRLQAQIASLTKDWQDKGIPLFRTYFRALAAAMRDLPQLATASGGKNTNLIMNGFNYTFQITDEELNVFLRAKNSLFENMSFRFTSQNVIADGKQDGVAVSIAGHYELDAASSGKNAILFHIDELTFNGYKLPKSTIAMLEQEFDLGIYPQNLASFLQVTGMKMEEGKLSVSLKFKL